MKKIFSIMLGLAMAMGVNAQTENPNRLIMMSQAGNKAYALDKIDSIYFAKKEGQVRADVKFLKLVQDEEKGNVLHVAVTRTSQDVSYCIDVLPTNTVKHYDDNTLARDFDMQKTQKVNQDVTDAELSGFSQKLEPGTSYTVFTIAYDEYGVPCEGSRAEFETPKAATVGNPTVSYTIDETTTNSFTITVTPNDDCAEYFWCSFGKGEAQAQFEQWPPACRKHRGSSTAAMRPPAPPPACRSSGCCPAYSALRNWQYWRRYPWKSSRSGSAHRRQP